MDPQAIGTAITAIASPWKLSSVETEGALAPKVYYLGAISKVTTPLDPHPQVALVFRKGLIYPWSRAALLTKGPLERERRRRRLSKVA